MSVADLFEKTKAQAQTGTLDWRALRDRIHDEFEAAASGEERDLLLGLFFAVMANVERQAGLNPEALAQFKAARAGDYNLLLVKECSIGENVSPDLMYAATNREIAAGRMTENHELRVLAVKGMAEEHFSPDDLLMQALVKHARDVAALQDKKLAEGALDFLPQFLDQSKCLFLFGAMLKFGERYRFTTLPEVNRAAIALAHLLVEQGHSKQAATERAARTHQLSTTPNGQPNLFVQAGYQNAMTEGAFAAALMPFKKELSVSGAPYRMLDRAKPISLILGIASTVLAILFGRSLLASLAIGLVVGGASIAIALAIYRQMIRPR